MYACVGVCACTWEWFFVRGFFSSYFAHLSLMHMMIIMTPFQPPEIEATPLHLDMSLTDGTSPPASNLSWSIQYREVLLYV